MGRAKLSMELIGKEKTRANTFRKRKTGLIKKMVEFTTLCDVQACMIIYGPKQDGADAGPEIWPESAAEVRRMIDVYRAKSKETGNKAFGLPDFYHDRKKRIEDELAKMRKKNLESKYPTRLELIDVLTEAQLRDFAAELAGKLEYVKSRIEFLVDFSHAAFYAPPGLRGIELELINQQAVNPFDFEMHPPFHYSGVDYQQVQQNSTMMLLTNDNDHCLQFGAASTSGNLHCASFKRQVFYESTSGVVDNVICHSPRQLARYYAPPLPALPPLPSPPFVQCAPPQLPLEESDDGCQDGLLQYQINSHGNIDTRYF